MASQNVATQKYSSSRCKIQLDQPVLHEVEAAGDEADVGDVIGVVAPDELDDDDGHVAEEVAQANRADGPRHAMVARRKLAVHVVTGECEFSKKIQFFVTYTHTCRPLNTLKRSARFSTVRYCLRL